MVFFFSSTVRWRRSLHFRCERSQPVVKIAKQRKIFRILYYCKRSGLAFLFTVRTKNNTWVNVITGYTLVKTRHSRVQYLLIYSVKRAKLIGRRPLSPYRVGKTAGYTLPRLLFSKTVPRFSEIYPDLARSGTLPSAIFSARITFRSQQRTPKPKFFCSKQAMATGIASLGGRSAPTKEHSSTSKHTMPLFYSVERIVATERATKGHINPNLPAWQPALLV